MREAWRKITIKDTKFSVFFLLFAFQFVACVVRGLRHACLAAHDSWLNFVKLARYQSYKKHRKEWLIRSQSVEVAKIYLHYFAKHLFTNSF